jgi:hypothetical protein
MPGLLYVKEIKNARDCWQGRPVIILKVPGSSWRINKSAAPLGGILWATAAKWRILKKVMAGWGPCLPNALQIFPGKVY